MSALQPYAIGPAGREPEAESRSVELTILMPCLNEAETIDTCIGKACEFLARSGIAGEILIADNGSSDGSVELALARGARVVAVAERGYGAALRAGIAAAQGRFVVMGDADDSYDFSRLDPFLAKLRDGCDLVMGNRFAGGIAPGAMPFLHRYLGNPVLSLIGAILIMLGLIGTLALLPGHSSLRFSWTCPKVPPSAPLKALVGGPETLVLIRPSAPCSRRA
jgi:Glycosyl transferase family 2